MTENYLDRLFYPGMIPAEDREWLRCQRTWHFVSDVIRLSGDKMRIVQIQKPVGALPLRVLLGTADTGATALRISDSGTDYTVNNWYIEMKQRGYGRHELCSIHAPYLLKALNKTMKRAQTPLLTSVLNAAENYSLNILSAAGTNMSSRLDSEFDRSAQEASVSLSGRVMHEALKVYFEDLSPLHVAKEITTKLRDTYKILNQRFQNRKSQAERVQDIFGGERLVIGSLNHGILVGSIQYVIDAVRAIRPTTLMPFKLYPSLADIEAQNPALHQEVMGQLTMQKVYAEKLTGIAYLDKDKFIPQGDHIFSDADAFCYFQSSDRTYSPQWLVLPRGAR